MATSAPTPLANSRAVASRRLVGALAAGLAVWGTLGIHVGLHNDFDATLAPRDTVAACAAHLLTNHVEARHTIRIRECPACLLSHLSFSKARPLAPALAAPAPERALPAAPVFAVSRLHRHSAPSRAPPLSAV